MINVGERITYFREQCKITTNKLANLTGLSQSFIRDVELSNKGITVDNLILICDVLKISLKDFFTEDTTKITDTDIINSFNHLSHEQKIKLLEFLNML